MNKPEIPPMTPGLPATSSQAGAPKALVQQPAPVSAAATNAAFHLRARLPRPWLRRM